VPKDYDLTQHPNEEGVHPLEISPFVEKYKRIIEEVVKYEKKLQAHKEDQAKQILGGLISNTSRTINETIHEESVYSRKVMSTISNSFKNLEKDLD
jgi:hypothetical protein